MSKRQEHEADKMMSVEEMDIAYRKIFFKYAQMKVFMVPSEKVSKNLKKKNK